MRGSAGQVVIPLKITYRRYLGRTLGFYNPRRSGPIRENP